MPELIFYFARYCHSMSNLLSQQLTVTLPKPVVSLPYGMFSRMQLFRDGGVRRCCRFITEQFGERLEQRSVARNAKFPLQPIEPLFQQGQRPPPFVNQVRA